MARLRRALGTGAGCLLALVAGFALGALAVWLLGSFV
jgi:hypothetical protein